MKKYFSLENLIYGIIFLLPTYLIKVRLGFLQTNILEMLTVVALVWWMTGFYQKEKIKKFYLNYMRYVFCVGIMLGGLFWSALSHGQALQSLGIIKSWFLLPLALTLIAADILAREKMKNIFWTYGLSALFAAVIALIYLFLGRLTYDARLQAFFNSPNYLAMYLVPGSIFFFWQAIFSRGGKKAWIAIFFILLALFFTRSYAAWGALFLAGCFMLWHGRQGLKKAYFSKGVLMVTAVAVLFFALQINSVKLNSLIGANPRSSLASREMIWRAAGRMVANNPLRGIGPANFQKTYLEYQKFYPPYLEWAVPHPQNLYLDFWLSGGLFGLFGFLGVLFFLGKDIWKSKNQDALAVLVMGIMVCILAHGFFDTTYFKNDLAIVFWLNFLALKENK